MANIHITIPHALSEKEAEKRIKSALKDAKKKYGSLVDDLTEEWKGNEGTFRLKIRGQKVRGSITIGAPDIELTGEIPLAFAFFKRKIETLIQKEAKKLLG